MGYAKVDGRSRIMFTVKLGNNQTFEASAVSQSYRADNSERLSIDITVYQEQKIPLES